MSFKAGIFKAISELKDRTGSSSIAIKKHMQANMPADKKWMNATFSRLFAMVLPPET
jgi:histone H1/5